MAVAAHPVDTDQIAATHIADVDRVAELEKHRREYGVVAQRPPILVELLLARSDDRCRVWHVLVELEVEAVVQHVILFRQREGAHAVVDHGRVRCPVVGGAARVEHHPDARRLNGEQVVLWSGSACPSSRFGGARRCRTRRCLRHTTLPRSGSSARGRPSEALVSDRNRQEWTYREFSLSSSQPQMNRHFPDGRSIHPAW